VERLIENRGLEGTTGRHVKPQCRTRRSRVFGEGMGVPREPKELRQSIQVYPGGGGEAEKLRSGKSLWPGRVTAVVPYQDECPARGRRLRAAKGRVTVPRAFSGAGGGGGGMVPVGPL
jgi:hypothetical protein